MTRISIEAHRPAVRSCPPAHAHAPPPPATLTPNDPGFILIWGYSLLDMGVLMKTTIEISDALLRAAKRRADERGTTLRALVEEGLRSVLEEAPPRRAFALRDASVDGQGLQPGVREGSWERLADLTYEGRGG